MERKRPSSVVILAVIAVVLGIAGLLALRGTGDSTPVKEAAPGTVLTSNALATAPPLIAQCPRKTTVPEQAWNTLDKIRDNKWPPPGDRTGTKGGGPWSNRERRLPSNDASGKPIRYQEWDVNLKRRGQTRDAERIVTGSDESAWYTGDHYRTFTRMCP